LVQVVAISSILSSKSPEFGSTCQNGVLVAASAGNTAAAFGRMCAENEIACLIVIPERGRTPVVNFGKKGVE
jgi:threonine synthase